VDPQDDFATCPNCSARNVRRTEVGLGWQELTQKEVERLELIDLRWHKEKDNYRVWDRMGARIPSIVASVLSLTVFVGLGIFLIWWGRTEQPPGERDKNMMIGLFILLLGGGYSLISLIKSLEYRDAYRAYLRRRLECVFHPTSPDNSPAADSEAIERDPGRA
jgi:hypothetical protein